MFKSKIISLFVAFVLVSWIVYHYSDERFRRKGRQ